MSLLVHAYYDGFRVDSPDYLRRVLARRPLDVNFVTVRTGCHVPLVSTATLGYQLSVQCDGSEVTISWDDETGSVSTSD